MKAIIVCFLCFLFFGCATITNINNDWLYESRWMLVTWTEEINDYQEMRYTEIIFNESTVVIISTLQGIYNGRKNWELKFREIQKYKIDKEKIILADGSIFLIVNKHLFLDKKGELFEFLPYQKNYNLPGAA